MSAQLIAFPLKPRRPAIFCLDERAELYDLCAWRSERRAVSELEQFIRDVRRGSAASLAPEREP